MMKTKNVSQRVNVNATLSSSVDSVSVEISLNVTPGEYHVAVLDDEHFDLIAVKRTKKNPPN